MSEKALLATLAAIALLLFLILRWKVHAFLALLLSSVALGVIAGMPLQSILSSVQRGMGELLGSVGLIVGAGAILGRLVEISGGGDVVARTLIGVFGKQRVPWALLVTAYLVGIPVFFDAGFFTLIPLAWNISKEAKKSLLVYALPLTASLTATHGLIPTHPGPAAAAQMLGAELSKTILYGLVLSAPMSVAAGIVWGGWIGKRILITAPENLTPQAGVTDNPLRRPPFWMVLSVILFPVVLIGLGTLLPTAPAWIKFAGSPTIALLAAACVALAALGLGCGIRADILSRHTGECLNSVGSLVLIIGASGAFKQVIMDCGAGASFGQWILRTHISPLMMAYLVGATLRLILGSATASIVTAAGIVAPIATSFPGVDRTLLVMALASGGSVFSHVNDAGFWMVKEYCGMTVPETLKSYSVMKTVVSITGLLSLWFISQF